MSRAPTAPPNIVLYSRLLERHFQDDRSVLGRTLQLNKHPFTVVGVAPPGFYGTLLFFSPSFFVPMVNQEQVDGAKLSERSRKPFHLRFGFHGDGTSESRGHAGASRGGS